MQSVKLTSGSSEKPADTQRQRGVGDQRPEERRRLEPLAARDVRRPATTATATVSRICAAAIDSCIAATMPTSDHRPICSSRSRGGTPAVRVSVVIVVSDAATAAARAASSTIVGEIARQAAKVARHAVPLMARPAGQRAGVDGDRADCRIAPRHRSLRQRRPEQRDDRRRASSPRCAAARCRRRCTAPRVRPARAARRDRTRRCARCRSPRRRPARAPRRRPLPRPRASDGPEVMIMRRAGRRARARRRPCAKDAAGQRRNGLPALTCITTIGGVGGTPAARSRASTRALGAGIDRHLDRDRARDPAARCRAAPADPTDSAPSDAAARAIASTARASCSTSAARAGRSRCAAARRWPRSASRCAARRENR